MRDADPGRPGLTARQCKIVQVIEDSVQDAGRVPTFREIGDAVGLASSSSVSYQLRVLQRMGYLTHEAGRPRAIMLQNRPWQRMGQGDGLAGRGGRSLPRSR